MDGWMCLGGGKKDEIEPNLNELLEDGKGGSQPHQMRE
jgi:hypothetical protein